VTAKVTEIIFASPTGIDGAVTQRTKRANKTLKNIKRA